MSQTLCACVLPVLGLSVQDRYEVLANQYAKSGIKGLTDMIMPAKDLSRCGYNGTGSSLWLNSVHEP